MLPSILKPNYQTLFKELRRRHFEIMTKTQLVPTSIRIGEVITLLLCFVLPTLAVFARMYTKVRLLKDVRLEDCKFFYLMEDICTQE